MGASSSTPKDLPVEEVSTGGTIKVSEAVARRLIGQEDVKEESAAPKPYIAVKQADVHSEVATLKSHYQKRIEALEKQNNDLHQIATEEFSRTLEDCEKKFIPRGSPKPICKDLQEEVMKCYRDNVKHSLLCSQKVREYRACVDEKRDGVLTRRDEECQPCILAQMARGPCGLHFMKAYDCYLENGDQEECGALYLEMKECWERYPSYGYQKIVDRAYKDTPKSGEGENTQDVENNNKEMKNSDVMSRDNEQTEQS